MNKLTFGIIAVIIVAALAISIVFVAGDVGPILPDNGDSGEDTDSTIADVSITVPGDGYTVPKKGPWHSIAVEGSIYGTNIGSVSKVIVAWHTGIDYGKQEISSSSFTQYDQYNTIWTTDMLIERLGSGEHTLTVRAFDSSGDVLSQDYITITIPEYYIYEWDSDDSSDVGSHWGYSYTFPIIPNGEVIRIKGDIHSSNNNEIWTSIWNGFTSSWVTVDKNTHATTEGWNYIDITVNNVYGTRVGFCGYTNYVVDGFKGEVRIKPGTINYQQSPLEIVMSIFGGESQDNPPHP